MPPAAVRLILVTAVIRAEVARRRHTENALAAQTVQHHPELVDRLLELQDSQPPPDPRALAGQAAAGALYAGRWRQARIRARTLVLQGGADTVVDPRNARLLANRIPDARLVTFPELGHLLFWEDPDGFTDAVTSFLLAGRGGQEEVPARHRFRSGAWRRTGTRAAVSGTDPAGPASADLVPQEKAASRP
jgi:pimeloyl-ACP methyl ester carboxylesterase